MLKERNLETNAHPPVCLSAAPAWIGFPNANWGTTLGPSFSVTLDPQVNVATGADRLGKGREQVSLVEMDRLLDEFADRNDEVLRELAR